MKVTTVAVRGPNKHYPVTAPLERQVRYDRHPPFVAYSASPNPRPGQLRSGNSPLTRHGRDRPRSNYFPKCRAKFTSGRICAFRRAPRPPFFSLHRPSAFSVANATHCQTKLSYGKKALASPCEPRAKLVSKENTSEGLSPLMAQRNAASLSYQTPKARCGLAGKCLRTHLDEGLAFHRLFPPGSGGSLASPDVNS